MKKKIVYTFLIFLAIILQTSVISIINGNNVPGDIVLMLILAGAVLDGFFGFFWWAIFAGIIFDLASYSQVGVHALIFLLVVYFVSFFSRRFSVDFKGAGTLLILVFVVVATFISRAIVIASISTNLQSVNEYLRLLFGNFNEFVFQVIFNVCLFGVCFFMLKRIKSYFNID